MQLMVRSIYAINLMAFVFLFGCSTNDGKTMEMVKIANPATEYCISQGGKSEISKDSIGNELGMCHLPDGTAIEEWEFFRRNNLQEEERTG